MISAQRIEYRGYSSVDFDLKTCMAFESDDGEVSTYLRRESVTSESYRGEFKRIHNFKYTETFNPKFTFIKDDFEDFTAEEIRKVLRWLTRGTNASFLTVYKDDSNEVHFEILGGFSNVSLYKISNGRCIGIVAEFESAHPYAFSPLYTYSQSVVNTAHQKFTINIDTDEIESPVYPRITIAHNNSVVVYTDHVMITNGTWVDDDYIDGTVYYYADAGMYYYNKYENGSVIPTSTNINPVTINTKTSVIIKNIHTDEDSGMHISELKIKNNTVGETIVLDGANRIVSSSNTKRIFDDDFINWNWLPLYNGKNEITVIGNCNITFEYRAIRKIGEI